MAFGARSRHQIRLDLDVPFTKTVSPDKLGKLIVEIVKYILYEREQVPTPYDDFKRSATHLAGGSSSPNKSQSMHPIKSVKQRKALASIEGMDLIFTSTQQLVEGNKLAQILLLFGPTVMSPIESYVIRVPKRSLTCRSCGDMSGFRRCMLQVLEAFRTVGQTDGNNAASTKLTTFLCLRRRDVEFGLMDVRPRFQVPRKGRLTVLNLSLPACRHNGSVDATGDASACECSRGLAHSCDDPTESTESFGVTCGDVCTDVNGDREWVWAQCKPVFMTLLGNTFPGESL
ncbi:unnamed protein product [Ixodes hexagonus]